MTATPFISVYSEDALTRSSVSRMLNSTPACVIVVILLYIATAKLGYLVVSNPNNVSAVWLPSGIALGAILLAGVRVWPGIWLGAFLANTVVYNGLSWGSIDVLLSISFSTGASLQAVVGAALIQRTMSDSNLLKKPEHVFKFVGVIALACIIAASVGAASLWVAGQTATSAIGRTWLTWWLGDLMGALVVTPLLLAWCRVPVGEPQRGVLETSLLFFTTVIICQIVFGNWLENVQPSVDWLIFPSLIWAANRFNQRIFTLSIIIISGFGVIWTVLGDGMFSKGDAANPLLLLQFYLGVITVSAMVLFATVYDRRSVARKNRLTQFGIDQAAFAVFWVVPDGRILLTNDAGCRLLGIAHTEIIGSTVFDLIPNVSADSWPAHWAELKEKKSLTYEGELRTKRGNILQIEVSANFIEFEGEEYNCVYIRDVTETKLAAEELQMSQFSANHTLDAVLRLGKDAEILYANDAAINRLGYSLDELLQMRVFDIDADFPADAWPEHWAKLKQNRSLVFESRHRSKDGRIIDVEINANFVNFGDGEYNFAFVRDITERKQAEIALRESEESTRLIIDSAPDAVVTMDIHGRIRGWNPQAGKVFGWGASEAIGQLIAETLFPSVQLGIFRRAIEKYIRTGESYIFNQHLEVAAQDRFGKKLTVEVRLTPVVIRGEQQFSAFIRDITEVKRTEKEREQFAERLLQSQKMEAIGTLAGGIAHDFNNILGAIMGYSELALMNPSDSANVQDSLEEISKASDRAKNLINQILTVSRRQAHERKPIDLHPVIIEVIQLMRPTLPSRVEINLDIHADAGLVLADATQIHQVILNLCTNAAHAIGLNTGRIEIQMRAFEADAILAQVQPDFHTGSYVCLSISDTGRGIDADTIKLIFDPFFTTKCSGEGTGLGLAVVNGIVKGHEGIILVESEPGVGTTFKLYFPVILSVSAESPSKLVSPKMGQGESILFVDDEAVLCRIAKTLLEKLNYNVTVFTDPREALDEFFSEPEAWDLVITDLSMPSMSGIELADEILRQYPQALILLTSGYSGTWTSEKVKSRGFFDLIPKPYSFESMGVVLQSALQSRQTYAAPNNKS